MAKEKQEMLAFPPLDEGKEEDIFERVMEHVGLKGAFQRRFNLIFNLVYVMLISMPCMNTVLIMTVPDHWCHVPGRNETNFTLDEWKELTVPRELGDGASAFSHCRMYNLSAEQVSLIAAGSGALLQANASATGTPTMECQNGWEYDTTWYSRTMPSDNDWVCENELRVSNTFAVSRIAETIGTFVFGQLADGIGRRPVFFIALLFLVVGRLMSGFVSGSYVLYMVATVIASLAVSPAFQSPLVISMEVSASDKRAHIAMMQCLGWTAGICLMPMLAWITGDWVVFLLVSTVPCAVFFLLFRQFPESPRWLATRGKAHKCVKVLKYICKVNGTKLPDDTLVQLQKLTKHIEKTYGFASLFSSWRLAKNTIIISISWVVNALSYYVIVLNVTNMAGNPFMNFFWQSLVELPGYIIGRALSDRFGRRWTQTCIMCIVPVFCIALCLAVQDPDLLWLCTALVVAVKFCITMTFYVVYLQALEIYPTCVRQTGTSCGALAANTLGILGPYIVYLGTAFDARYPYIVLGGLTLTGGICVSFLPETLYQKLPETLNDAQHFGEDQSYWNFKYAPLKTSDESDPPMKTERQKEKE